LKPFGLAEFTESAALWDICSSRLRLHVSCLASSANSTIAQFRWNVVYFVLKNLVLWARSEFFGSAWRIAARVWSEL